MDAVDRAISRIEINAGAFVARKQRIASDPRIVWLKAYAAAADAPITCGGSAGAWQVFLSLSSAANVQVLRAEALIQARIHQLDGLHQPASDKLARAAELRRQLVEFNRITETERAA